MTQSSRRIFSLAANAPTALPRGPENNWHYLLAVGLSVTLRMEIGHNKPLVDTVVDRDISERRAGGVEDLHSLGHRPERRGRSGVTDSKTGFGNQFVIGFQDARGRSVRLVSPSAPNLMPGAADGPAVPSVI